MIVETLHTSDGLWGEAGTDFVEVRLGERWVNLIGQCVNLCECDTTLDPVRHEVIGNAELSWAHMYTLSAIPEHVLVRHHSVACRTWAGLVKNLTDTYGPDKIGGAAFVAVLGIRRWD